MFMPGVTYCRLSPESGIASSSVTVLRRTAKVRVIRRGAGAASSLPASKSLCSRVLTVLLRQGSGGFFRTLNAVLTHLFDQGGTANLKFLRGMGNDTIAIIKRLLNQADLDIGQVLL